MALVSSHIRFSIDLKEKFNISSECDYILGSIYPDSRYITKVDRYATHPINEYKTDPIFKKDDFRKGWYTHLLCDDIQYVLIQELFPEVRESNLGEQTQWIQLTAIKILQDIEDVKSFNIQKYLSCLSEVKNPNGEDKELIKIYNKTFQELYANPEHLTIDSYTLLWERWKIDSNVGNNIIEQAKIFQQDEDVMQRIRGLYSKILEKVI